MADTHYPEYDGRTVFLPDVSALLPGDIILTSSAESRQAQARALSDRIRDATAGRFSHALICTQPPTCAEAILSGVSSLSLVNCFMYDPKNIRVLRYHDAEIAQKAATYAQLEIGREYSIRKAKQSLFANETITARIADNGTFCSAFVAQAFVRAGAVEFSTISVERTTPATLDTLTGLNEITLQVFRSALVPKNAERMSALDGDRAATPSSPQTLIFRRYAKAVLPLADYLVDEFPEADLAFQATYFGILKLILDSEFTLPRLPQQLRAPFLAAIQDLDHALAAQQADGAIEVLSQTMMDSDQRELQRDLAESFRPKPDIDVSALQRVYVTGERSIMKRKRAVDSMRSSSPWRAIAYHCHVQDKGIAFMMQRQRLVAEVLARMGHSVTPR